MFINLLIAKKQLISFINNKPDDLNYTAVLLSKSSFQNNFKGSKLLFNMKFRALVTQY